MRLAHVTAALAGGGILLSLTAMSLQHPATPSSSICEQPVAASPSPSPSATPSASPSPSSTPSPSPSATPSASPSPSSTPSPSPTVTPTPAQSSAALAAPVSLVISTPPSLCLSVTPLASSVAHGQPAQFTVQVWAKNWPYGKVTVLLSGQAAQFTTNCPSREKSASCTIPAPGPAHTKLHAQLAVSAGARTVTITAAAHTAAITLPHPLVVTDTLNVAARSEPSPAASPAALPPIQLPTLSPSRSVLSAGNASGLFPAISPSLTPSASAAPAPAPAGPAQPSTAAKADPPGLLPLGTTLLTAQALGLVALVAAIALAVARRRRA
jgi:hypothetical protein